MKINVSGVMKYLLGEPQPPRLSKKQRRQLRRIELENKHREEFLDYMDWMTSQPKSTTK